MRTRPNRWLATLAVALTMATALSPSGAQASAGKTSAFYVVIAHSDDEVPTWQLIDDFQDHYTVFVTTTRGEGTYACITHEETETYKVPRDTSLDPTDPANLGGPGDPATGAWMYEGPGSPVGETDLNERDPFGDPWQGQFKESCKKARIASWHWFLDEMAAVDPGFPDFGISNSANADPWLDDDYRGEFCPISNHHSSSGPRFHPGTDPHNKHSTVPNWSASLGCADVWATQTGARVAFDFGNGSLQDPEPFTEAEVVEAIEVLSANRDSWGIPELPEAGLMSAAPSCDVHADDPANEDDHNVVANALYNHDFGMGPQYGAVCDGNTNSISRLAPGTTQDSRYAAHPAEQQPTDVLEWWFMHEINPATMERIGPAMTNYGWLENAEYHGTVEFTMWWDFPYRTMWKRYGDS